MKKHIRFLLSHLPGLLLSVVLSTATSGAETPRPAQSTNGQNGRTIAAVRTSSPVRIDAGFSRNPTGPPPNRQRGFSSENRTRVSTHPNEPKSEFCTITKTSISVSPATTAHRTGSSEPKCRSMASCVMTITSRSCSTRLTTSETPFIS